MLEKSEAEQLLETLRTARLASDVEGSLSVLADDAVFGIVGIGPEVRGKEAIRSAVTRLFEDYEFLDWRRVQTFVEGDDIAARHHLKVRHRASGAVVETETSEFVTVRDGRISAFRQYADTALIASMSLP